MIYDIRSKDFVNLKDLQEEDKTKLLKFVGKDKDKGFGLVSYFQKKVLENNGQNLVVESIGRTEKTKTEFAVVTQNVEGGESAIRFAVQTRFLKLVKRFPKHPVTHIFSDTN